MKEVNQSMSVRMKAGQDVKRIAEERNAAMQGWNETKLSLQSLHKSCYQFKRLYLGNAIWNRNSTDPCYMKSVFFQRRYSAGYMKKYIVSFLLTYGCCM
jgi:hypothetical protein